MSAGTVDMHRVVTEDEVKALTTIEVTERLIARAFRLLADEATPSEDTLAKVQDLLLAASTETSIRTCTSVKSLALSDQIAADARTRATSIITKVEAR